jgi:hypothetical protein
MDKKGETTLQAPYATTGHAKTGFSRRLAFQLVAYGATAGLVTTALGALASSGVTGTAKIVLWIFVTGVLAVGAIGLADPAFVLLIRRHWRGRLRRTPTPR